MNVKNKTKIAVHNGVFHADDVFAVAILQLIEESKGNTWSKILTVVRTRDSEELAACDLRVDVGGKYDPTTGDFDHHQPEGAGERENGIPFAACGLIWKHYGQQLCSSDGVWKRVDLRLIQMIDAHDTGFSTYEKKGDFLPYSISRVIDLFNPGWMDSSPDYLQAFFSACELARGVLGREISNAQEKEEARSVIKNAIASANDKRIIVLDKFCPWQETVVRESSEAQFVVFESPTHDWRVRAVPVELGSFVVRTQLPERWGGLQGAELARVSGVSDAVFCHRGRFICGAESKEGALLLAKKALGEIKGSKAK